MLYLCTGSQGEPRAALARIAEGRPSQCPSRQGRRSDFFQPYHPGNELPIFELHNQLSALGVEVLTERIISSMSRAIRRARNWPRCTLDAAAIAVPVHGELRHLAEHARLAKSLQVPEALVPANGQLYRLAPGPAELIDEVPSGRIHLDGRVLVAEGEGLTKTRRAMAYAGLIAITLVLDGKGRVAAEPAILIEGMPEPVHEAIRLAVAEMTRKHAKGDADQLPENVSPGRAAGGAGRLG